MNKRIRAKKKKAKKQMAVELIRKIVASDYFRELYTKEIQSHLLFGCSSEEAKEQQVIQKFMIVQGRRFGKQASAMSALSKVVKEFLK